MADKSTESKNLSRRDFGKVVATVAGGAVGLAYGESHKDYSKIGFDPDIRRALEQARIGEGVNLRIYSGNHFFTENTAKEMKLQGVTVLTGEIQSNPLLHTPQDLEPESLLTEFLTNLAKPPNGVTAMGQMELSKERHAMLLKDFSKDRAVLISDAHSITGSQKAASRVLGGWTLLGSLAYISAIANKTNIVNEFNKPITRRNFLRMLAVLPALPVASAIAQVAENRGWVEPPANSEVSYVFSKLFNSAVDISTKYLEMTSDERLVQAFQSLVSVRNKIMSLNNWYLIDSLERNVGVKEKLIGNDGRVEIGFFAGLGHASVKFEFCKGPAKLAEELKSTVTDWLSQYQTDMDKAESVEEKGKVLDYYTGLMKMFNKPELISERSINQENAHERSYIPSIETPAALMYRTLIKKIDEGVSANMNIDIYRQLVGNLVRDQHFPDGTYNNVSGKIILSGDKYIGEMVADDPGALKKRFIESNFVCPGDLEQIDGEVYPNLYNYDYIGPVEDKNVSVGLVIVRGMPMTFFQKEDTSFISNNP